MANINDGDENDLYGQKTLAHTILSLIFYSYFVKLMKRMEVAIREQIVEVYSHPKVIVAVVLAQNWSKRAVKMMVNI